MNPLQSFFDNHQGRLIDKWDHYFDIYDRHFSRFRNKKPRVLEIGVSQGGSFQMWEDYFGPGATLVGMDVDPRCKALDPRIIIGDQGSLESLRWMTGLGPFDIVIDDGGHTMQQQILSFEVLYPFVNPDGVYLVEDCHTSYWESYGGNDERNPRTFIEFSKRKIDELNGKWIKHGRGTTPFTNTCDSITAYDSVVVFEKRVRHAPVRVFAGNPVF